jgi:hypothetical protein
MNAFLFIAEFAALCVGAWLYAGHRNRKDRERDAAEFGIIYQPSRTWPAHCATDDGAWEIYARDELAQYRDENAS